MFVCTSESSSLTLTSRTCLTRYTVPLYTSSTYKIRRTVYMIQICKEIVHIDGVLNYGCIIYMFIYIYILIYIYIYI